MSEMHYDHDQSERDYYDSKSQKHLKDLLTSAKVFGIMTLLLILCLWMFSGCKTHSVPIALPYGPVISVDGDLVEVSHEVINKQKGSQIASWYYVPGHRFVKGDIFPDFTRYINPTPRSVSPPTGRIKPEIK